MSAANDLMQRLAVSKKIMEKTEQIKRGDARPLTPNLENFDPVEGKYNIPSELLAEETVKPNYDPTKPLEKERILNSKLPDEIKQLMFEHPIVQPSGVNGSVEISDEVIQGAQRLMNLNSNKISDLPKTQVSENIKIQPQNSSNINMGEIKSMIRDVVRDTVRDVVREELKDAGMLVESTQNANEVIQFKVGQHLFVGKVTKIKKLEK
jgi:hypothetical protein